MPKGDKLSERAKPVVLMGYSTTQKGFLLLDLNSNKFFVSKDVKESIVLFTEKRSETRSIDSFKSCTEDSSDDEELVDLADIVDDQTLNTGELSQITLTPILPVDAADQPTVQPPKSFPLCIDNVKPILHKRTSKVSKEPIWMKDYTIPGKRKDTRHPIVKYLSDKNTTSRYQCYMSSFSDLVEP